MKKIFYILIIFFFSSPAQSHSTHYKGIVKIDGELKEAMIPYNSCVDCRNKDKAKRRGVNVSSKK